MKSMKRTILGLFLMAVIIFVLFMTTVTLYLDAAESKCTNGKLSCEGDCCKVTATECIAGPCDVIFPLQ